MKKITLLFLFLIGSITTSFGQLSQDFEGTWPPAGWTILTTNADATWMQEPDFGINGVSARVPYDFSQDESLVSPVFTVPTGAPSLDFKLLMSYYWSVDPNDNDDLLVSISTDGGTTWTQVWSENDLGIFPNFEEIDVHVPLTTYAGQTNAKLKFEYIGDDGADVVIDDVKVDIPPTTVPDCAVLTTPTNAATGINYTDAVTLSWTAPTTGPAPDSYDVYIDTNASPTTLLGNQTALTVDVTGLMPTTTYYWKAVPKNVVGSATGCTVFSFTTMANPFAPYCGPITFTTNVEPITLVNFAGINNVTSPTLNGTPAHEDFTSIVGNVVAGSAYTITLQGNSDGNFVNRYMVFADWNQDGDFADSDEAYTITQTTANSTGTDGVQATQSLQVPPTATVGNTRMRVKKIYGTADYTDPCLGADYGQVEEYTLHVDPTPADLPDYVGLQFPAAATVDVANNVTVYGQVYEAGLTDVAPNIVGQAPGITASVGISTTDTNPNTWTNWTPATWNSGSIGNNDEYQASIGATLAPGTYYYAVRFQLNGGAFVYGGINTATDPDSGNFWDGTTYKSGILTVNPLANDECSGAVALIPGGVFETNAITTTNVSSTDTDGLTPSCQTNFTNNVWYSVVVPASGSVTVETQPDAGSGFTDSVIGIFSGTCGALTEVDCNDDTTGGANFFSTLTVAGQTPGATLYISVWRYSLGVGVDGTFRISAYDASLANSSFDNANFTYYPNPVKNTLNLSYNQQISTVEVFNLLGQKVSSNKINANSGQIDMSNLANGAYMVKVTSDNQVKTIKVIKE